MRNLFLGWKVSGDGDTTREKFLTSTSSSSSASSSSAGTSAAAAADGLWGKLLEPISPRDPRSPDEWLYNQDCAPTMKAGRTLTARDMGSLWVALVVGVPTYYLAGSLVEMGMAWWQGVLTVLLANVIVLIPMVLSAHAGTKFGIPFPVIARASFGIRGANVPCLFHRLWLVWNSDLDRWSSHLSAPQHSSCCTSSCSISMATPSMAWHQCT